MSHLGSRISALVDGQLSVEAAERALAHVAACAECAAELAAARQARRALAAADDVVPTSDLTARLLSLASDATGPREPFGGDPFAPPGRRSGAELASYGLAGGGLAARAFPGRSPLRGDVAPRRSPVRLAVGSFAGLGAVAAMLFVLGERPDVVPVSHPGVDLGMLGDATSAHPATFGAGEGAAEESGADGTLEWLRDNGWSIPATMPAGWSVTAVRWSGDDQAVLEVDVASAQGTVVITEQQGRLDVDALAGAATERLGGRDVYVLSYEPWHVAWQADTTVVQVVGTPDDRDVDALVAAFPGGAFDDGVPARITRGWDTVTGVLRHP